jgi:hypothetical protein
LVELKKKVAGKLVDKIWVPFLLRKRTIEYLVDKGTFGDYVRDKIIEKLWEDTFITPALDGYRKELSKLKTKSELDDFCAKNFNDNWWIELASSTVKEEATSGASTSSDKSDDESSDSKEWSDSKWSKKSSTKSKSSSDSEKSDQSLKESTVWSNEKAKESSGKIHEIDKFDIHVSPEAKKLWNWLKWKEKPAIEPFACACKAYNIEKSRWNVKKPDFLTIVDFAKERWTNRCFVINMKTNSVEYSTKVGHGKWSGWTVASKFSNTSWSNQSSLWLYTIGESLHKSVKWWSWYIMNWKEKKINDLAADRKIYMHPGSEAWSLWCFTLPKNIAHEIMEKVKWSVLFAFAKSKDYFAQSDYFKQNSDGSVAA